MNAFADEIEKDAISVAASTNADLGQIEKSDWRGKNKHLGMTAEVGYFIARNWEIGSGIDVWYSKHDKNDLYNCAFTPYAGYHWTLNDHANIYARFGAGYGFGVTGYSSNGSLLKSHLTLVFGEVRYEYFLTQNIALDLGLLGERSWIKEKWDDEDEVSVNGNTITTQLKFKFYF